MVRGPSESTRPDDHSAASTDYSLLLHFRDDARYLALQGPLGCWTRHPLDLLDPDHVAEGGRPRRTHEGIIHPRRHAEDPLRVGAVLPSLLAAEVEDVRADLGRRLVQDHRLPVLLDGAVDSLVRAGRPRLGELQDATQHVDERARVRGAPRAEVHHLAVLLLLLQLARGLLVVGPRDAGHVPDRLLAVL
eukprot:351331-Pyramimonas_sp.AAC.1